MSGLRQRAWSLASAGAHGVVSMGGRDATSEIPRRRTLVLACHPDDEVLGCGATILLCRRAGTPVDVVLATDGEASASARSLRGTIGRRREFEEAASALGVRATWPLGLPDGMLAHRKDEVSERIREIADQVAPEQVLVTDRFDPHPDHRALAEAAVPALAGRTPALYEYPLWALSDWRGLLRRRALRRGTLRISAGAVLEQKREIMRTCYPSQQRALGAEQLACFFQPSEILFPAPPHA